MKVKNIGNIIKHLLFPARCAGCDELLERGEKGFCALCREKIIPTAGNICGKCGRPLIRTGSFCHDCSENRPHMFESGRAVYVYEGVIKESMYRFKYSGRRCYAGAYVADAIRLHKNWLGIAAPDVILPVPMFDDKMRRRGYNQAEVFARELGKELGVPCRSDIIIRRRNTIPMKGLTRQKRQNNVKNAFLISKSAVQFKRILIVDDIITTGATIDEIARVIRSSTGAVVYAMYICVGRGK